MMHRCRLAGRIGDDEWELRRRLPIYLGAPLNIRAFCGERAGVQIAIGTRLGILPAMPTSDRPDWVPEFDELASSARLVRHARSLTRQRIDTANHPVEREIMFMRAQGWATRGAPVLDQPTVADAGPPITTIVGGSTGDMDAALPHAYPIGSTTPVLRLEDSSIHLRCRFREFYLGASRRALAMLTPEGCYSTSKRRELPHPVSCADVSVKLFMFYDANQYAQDDCRAYIDETRSAFEHFVLGHRSPSARL